MSDNERLEIFYVRHANTQPGSNGDRDICDIDLTPLGEEQIKLLGKRFENYRFDAIISSPLIRCVKTAAAVAKSTGYNPTIEIMPELIEKGSTPNYSGCSLEYLSRYYDKLCYCPDIVYGEGGGKFPNEEKEDIMARCGAIAEYLKNRFGYGKKIMLVSHGVFGISFFPSAMGISEKDFRMTFHNASVSKITYHSDGVKRISFHNDVSHLISIMPNYQDL